MILRDYQEAAVCSIFDYFAKNHNLTLLESEMHDIERVVSGGLVVKLFEANKRIGALQGMLVRIQSLLNEAQTQMPHGSSNEIDR